MNSGRVEKLEVITLKDVILKGFDYLAYLRTKWLWIGSFTLIGICLGYVYTKKQKATYEASIKFFVQGGGSSVAISPLSVLGIGAAMPTGGSGKDIFEASDITYIMTSAPILERTLLSRVKFSDQDDFIINLFVKYRQSEHNFFGKQIAYINQKPYNGKRDSLDLEQNLFIRSVIKDLESNLKVEKGTTGLISGTFKSTDPEFPKYFLEELIEETSEYYVYTKTAGSVRNIKSLESQADSIKNIMTGVISTTAYSADADPNSVRPNIVKVDYQKNQLDNTILQSTYQTLTSSLVSSRIELNKLIPFIQVYERPVLPLEIAAGSSLKVNLLKFGFVAFVLSVLVFSSVYYLRMIKLYLKS